METSFTAPNRLRSKPSWLIGKAALQCHRVITGVLAEAGARGHHFAILAALEEYGAASQVSIGLRCQIDRSDMAAMVNELVDQGLVARAADPADRRRNVITLIAAGRRRLEELDVVLSEAQRELFAPLSATEREQLAHLLGRIVDHHAPPGS